MNKLNAIIKNIEKSGSIMLVDASIEEFRLFALLIETTNDEQWLYSGNSIKMVFKETEVALAKDLTGIISMRNRLPCTVKNIERGELISKVTLQFLCYNLMSAITTRSLDMLRLNIGEEVEALIKANEISLMKN